VKLGCETWSLGEEHTVRSVFETKREDITRGWRKFHELIKFELFTEYYSVIK